MWRAQEGSNHENNNTEAPTWERLRTSIALALAYSAEAADTVLLTSMYLGTGRSLGVSLLGLGTLAMYRGLVQVLHMLC